MSALVLALVMMTGLSHLPTNLRATTCTWRLAEALHHSKTRFATNTSRQSGLGLLEHRFEKPDAVKLWLEGPDTLWIELHWDGQFLRFYSKGGEPRAYFDPTEPAVRSAPLNRRAIARLAVKRQCDAVISAGKAIYIPKFFRKGLGEIAFRKAVRDTIASDLAGCDTQNESAEAQMCFGESAAHLREKLRAQPFTTCRRHYDSREFPIEIQREIAFVTEQYWQTAQWQFIGAMMSKAQ